ncbi:SAV0927 family protein [Gracilibacillus massiliensis]|uniref:SAV0927 family protein n=1 Tax=Gracilibacillus massiliensis TaxID=1564956 RepID=UPI00071DEE0A|nr:SAV0927 family protein [Gracilibacillus massiliensis]
MSDIKLSYFKNEQEPSDTRFISFKGASERFDLAIITSNSLGKDYIILDMNSNKYSRLNLDTIDQPNYVEHAFQYNEMEAEDFRAYLKPLLNEN